MQRFEKTLILSLVKSIVTATALSERLCPSASGHLKHFVLPTNGETVRLLSHRVPYMKGDQIMQTDKWFSTNCWGVKWYNTGKYGGMNWQFLPIGNKLEFS